MFICQQYDIISQIKKHKIGIKKINKQKLRDMQPGH